MMRSLRHLATLLIGVVVTALPPAAATMWIVHHPEFFTLAAISRWVMDPPPEAPVVGVAVGVAVVLWALAALSVLRTATRTLAHAWRRTRNVPLPSATQLTAGSLAGTAILGVAAGGTHDNASPDPGPTAVTAATQLLSPPAATTPAGVDLGDGGWIPRHHADQVAAIAGLYWLRRRQTAPTDTGRLPPTAATITTGLADISDQSAPLANLTDLPAGLTVMSGPGAHAAARGLLVTTLMTTVSHAPPLPRLIISRDDYATLLGPAAPTSVPGLHLTTANDTSSAAQHEHALLLTSQHPAHQSASRAVVFSDDSSAADSRWRIDANGDLLNPAGPTPHRLCVLSARTAVDLITLIAAAHAPVPPGTDAAPPAHAGGTAPATARLRLTVLGDPDLTIDGKFLAIRRSSPWQILILLTLHPRGLSGRELIEALWPGLPPTRITGRLYTAVNDLRTQLRNHTDDAVILTGDAYRLNPAAITADVWLLDEAITAATSAITTQQRHAAISRLIAAYSGELARNLPWSWLEPHRERYRRHIVDGYLELAERQPPAEAITTLQQAITVDPYHERLHAATVAALIQLNDRRAAVRLHNAYLERLAVAGLRPTRLTEEVTASLSYTAAAADGESAPDG